MPLPARRRDSRTESLWACGGFLAVTAVFVLVIELRFPHWTDPEYAARRACVVSSAANHPDRPVLAVLGSSRTGTGFMPEELGPVYDPEGRETLVLNFSHLGAGPRMNLLQIRRLEWDGIAPRWLVVELLPGHLHHEANPFTEMSVRDARVWYPYANGPRLAGQVARYRLEALNVYRAPLLDTFAPSLATKHEEVTLLPQGGDDGWERHTDWTERALAALNATIRQAYEARMGTLRIDPRLDAAQRDLLRLCRDRGIGVVLVMFPENDTFRSWYGPGVEERIQEYLAGLRTEFGVTIVDTRRWMPEDCFNDPHHLTTAGAKQFTARLEAEVIRPLVAGKIGR